MIVALVAAGQARRRHARTATRSSATCSTRSSRPPKRRTSSVRIGQKVSRDGRRARRCASTRRRRERRGAGRTPRPAPSTSRPARLALGAGRRATGIVDVLFVDEAGRSRWPTCWRWRGSADVDRPPRRPAAARSAPQGIASARRGSVGPRAPARRRATMPARARSASSSSRPGGSIRTVTAFTSDAFYEGQLESRPDLARPAPPRPGAAARGRRPLAADRPRRRRQRVTGGGARRSPRSFERCVESGSTWIDSRATSSRSATTDILVVAPYNAQVGADPRASCRPRRGWARSTSSRGRRRRSASTR